MISKSSDPASWADASLPLNGLPNFRDFGGYATRDGRRVRRGVLYRSQAFAGATEQDLEYLDGLGIRLAIEHDDAAASQAIMLLERFARRMLRLDSSEPD